MDALAPRWQPACSLHTIIWYSFSKNNCGLYSVYYFQSIYSLCEEKYITPYGLHWHSAHQRRSSATFARWSKLRQGMGIPCHTRRALYKAVMLTSGHNTWVSMVYFEYLQCKPYVVFLRGIIHAIIYLWSLWGINSDWCAGAESFVEASVDMVSGWLVYICLNPLFSRIYCGGYL
jgi:hypothetical protein